MSERAAYVIGHKNPDTDSVVSALAYAELRTRLGDGLFIPARAGKLNPQTAYILDRFGIDHPLLLNDLTPKVKHYMTEDPCSLNEDESLWKALMTLDERGFKMLPITDSGKHYTAVLHYNVFAQKMIKRISPGQNRSIPTTISHLMSVMNARPVCVREGDDLFDSRMLVAAMEEHTFSEYLESVPSDCSVVIVGDRKDIQNRAVEHGVRVLIVTGGKDVDNALREKAEKNGVSILVSPCGTSMTSWLALYSTPVSKTGDYSIAPVSPEDYVYMIRDRLNKSISRCLPVVDGGKKLVGVISQGDLMRSPSHDIIMVDHNESSQAVDGIEHFNVTEIIDHHRLGNLHTDSPVTFINRPVGSTSTIIAGMFREKKALLTKTTAALLMAGIVSDTLMLRSATTTEEDRDMCHYLSTVAELDIEAFGHEIMSVSSDLAGKTPAEIVEMDVKEYRSGRHLFTVSQIEVLSTSDMLDRKEELLKGLDAFRSGKNAYFSSLMVTDITKLDSYLLVRGNGEFLSSIEYPLHEKDVFFLSNILSRKKQLLPYLLELVKKFGQVL